MKSIDTQRKRMLESSQGGDGWIDRLISTKEAAKMLGISPMTIWKWITQGKLPSVRVGRLWKVRESDVEAYIRSHTHGVSKRDEEPRDGR